MSKNGSSFELCSIVNLILGWRFCVRLCNSLMSPHEHFQNMKRSCRYLFHDLVNSPFILWSYFLPIISYRFSSEYARVIYMYIYRLKAPCLSSHTNEFWYNETVCLEMTLYLPLTGGGEHFGVMQSSSNELSTSDSDSVRCKQKKINTLNSMLYVGAAAGCGLMLSGWRKISQVSIPVWSVSRV